MPRGWNLAPGKLSRAAHQLADADVHLETDSGDWRRLLVRGAGIIQIRGGLLSTPATDWRRWHWGADPAGGADRAR